MIETICNIGKTVQNIDEEQDIIDLWQKEENENYDLILEIDVSGDSISVDSRDFEKKVFRDGLLYTQGNWFVGALVKKDSYKEKNIKKSLDFLDIPEEKYDNIKDTLDQKIEEYKGSNFVILFKKDGKTPVDIAKGKFLEEIEKNGLKKVNYSGYCQMCNQFADTLYDSIIYKCYTNDKNIFSNTDGLSYGICYDCLINILAGRKYIHNYLETWWGGSKMLFLPHDYNIDIKEIFENADIGDLEDRSLLKKIRESEDWVMQEIGKCHTNVDIIFFSSQKSEWKITYHIRDVMPSRFTEIAEFETKYAASGYNLKLWQVLLYLLGGNSKINEIFGTNEAKNYLSDIFHGNKINRRIFFSRAMKKYRHDYYEGYKQISSIHRVYNFLVDCGCLSNGWKLVEKKKGVYEMAEYETEEQFFEENSEFFDNSVKKAWFLLGHLYNAMIYESKKYKSGDDLQNATSHLEKNFFFGRKFDFKTFVYIANQCSELMYKYGVQNKKYLNNYLSSSKELMGAGNEKIPNDEAKYIFFWGMQQWIGKSKNNIKVEGVDE
ncbi:TIGR02556 family CRISPR-associated protein [Methanohalophilus sp.]